jgi:DNA polymerase elongation subunit (family B)
MVVIGQCLGLSHYLCYRHKPNIHSSNRESFKHDFESIHLATWTKHDSYNYVIVNVKDGETPSSIFVYNVVVRKLTYEEKDLKGEMVKIYKKPQELINYLIDTFSNEGYWVLICFEVQVRIMFSYLRKHTSILCYF